MKMYETPVATLVALKTDVILTSPIPTLQDGTNVSITNLKSFNWNS